MNITRNKNKKQLLLSQTKYIKELLIKFEIKDEKSIYSSTIQEVRLKKNLETINEHVIKLYQQQIKSLMYLMIVTRSNLIFSISNCARLMSNSSEEHVKVLQRIWQYVKTSQNKDLLYKSNDNNTLDLIEYVDSDWESDYITRKSITSYLFLFDNTFVSWSLKLQTSIAINFCQVEYMTLKEVVKKLIWLKSIFKQIISFFFVFLFF